MKKLVVLIFVSFSANIVFSESIDSLKTKREKLYQKYSDVNIPGKELSKDDLEKIVSILKEIVIVDTRIIRENIEFDKKAEEYENTINSLNKENYTLSKKLSSNTGLLLIIYIAGGVLVVLLILGIVLLLIHFLKFRSTKKKMLNYSEILKNAETDRLKYDNVNEAIAKKDADLIKRDAMISELQKEKNSMIGKIKSLEDALTGAQKRQNAVSPEYDSQIEKVNINISKIEKLGRMKELGIVTEEEFNTFKQKFLSEL